MRRSLLPASLFLRSTTEFTVLCVHQIKPKYIKIYVTASCTIRSISFVFCFNMKNHGSSADAKSLSTYFLVIITLQHIVQPAPHQRSKKRKNLPLLFCACIEYKLVAGICRTICTSVNHNVVMLFCFLFFALVGCICLFVS